MCPSAVLDADITSPSAERDLLMNCDSFNLSPSTSIFHYQPNRPSIGDFLSFVHLLNSLLSLLLATNYRTTMVTSCPLSIY